MGGDWASDAGVDPRSRSWLKAGRRRRRRRARARPDLSPDATPDSDPLLFVPPLSSSSPQIKVVLDTTHDPSALVSVVSGGGSGHEPFAGGFVGPGLLAAAAVGEVFASP